MQGDWHDFFAAQVGAAAALTGLLFVALSLNIARILQYPWLPSRAGVTLAVLVGALVEASLALFPDRFSHAAVIQLGVTSCSTWLFCALLTYGGFTKRDANIHARWIVAHIITAQLATVPAVVAFALAAAGAPAAYTLLADAILVALVLGVFNAWVLLVEILR